MKNKKVWITAVLLSGTLDTPGYEAAVISPGSENVRRSTVTKDGRFTENRRRYGRVRGSSCSARGSGIGSSFLQTGNGKRRRRRKH